MRTRILKLTSVIALTVVTALTMTSSMVSGQNTQDKQSSESLSHRQRTIVGAWRTMVTPRNCQTGDPVVPPFPGLFTFNEDGIMSQYGIGPGSSPALVSPGIGVWQRERGRHDYSFAFTHYRYNASGVLIGSQKVTAALELGASGDEFTSNSAIQVFDANDNLISTGCATAAGTRFE